MIGGIHKHLVKLARFFSYPNEANDCVGKNVWVFFGGFGELGAVLDIKNNVLDIFSKPRMVCCISRFCQGLCERDTRTEHERNVAEKFRLKWPTNPHLWPYG